LQVSAHEWLITLSSTIAVLLFDLVVIGRRPQEPKVRNCVVAWSLYAGFAVVFGIWVLFFHGHKYGEQFYAGWLTEYSLSIDNLFAFMVIIANFGVPKAYQLRALFFGVVISLMFRGVFLVLGGVALQRFTWLYLVFGAFNV
jgi:tellurite resistance protein TerC